MVKAAAIFEYLRPLEFEFLNGAFVFSIFLSVFSPLKTPIVLKLIDHENFALKLNNNNFFTSKDVLIRKNLFLKYVHQVE
jgi:hypothetical protein